MKSIPSGKISKIHSTSIAVNINHANNNVKFSPAKKSNNDLFAKIRGLIYLGKFIGVIPCKVNFFGRHRSWKLGHVISLIISIILGINGIISFIGMCRMSKKNAADLAWAAATWVYYSYGTFLYTYFLRNSEELYQLFPKWSNVQLQANLNDKSLSRDAGIITCFLFTSAVLENLLLQFIEFPAFEPGTNNSTDSTLETYYRRSHSYWANLIPYHKFWAIFVLISNKLALYVWNFADILIAVLSRAIHAKFRLLYEDVERKTERKDSISVQEDFYEGSKNEGLMWIQLARDHSAICNLLAEFERFLSPVIFCSYGINIYFACLQLFLGLTPTKDPPSVKSTLHTIYTTWSFVHLITRLYVVSISSANVNVHAHLVSRVLRRCPVEHYTTEVERMERKVNAGPEIGLNGLGCFTITKPFILSIIGVITSFEIVLLQSSPQPTSNETNCTTT